MLALLSWAHTPSEAAAFTLAPDFSFEDGPSQSLAFAKNTTVLQSRDL